MDLGSLVRDEEKSARTKLASTYDFEILQRLPKGLGDLPLYPDEDGYFSVNDPRCLSNPSPRRFRTLLVTTPVVQDQNPTHPLINHIFDSTGQPPGSYPSHQGHSDNSLVCLVGSQRGCPERKSYACNVPDCTWRLQFRTRQALKRHRAAKHLNERVNCPIPGCKRVGDKGIKRKDNLPSHILNKHGIKWSLRSRCKEAAEDAVITGDHSC